jgi:hypothetical protein
LSAGPRTTRGRRALRPVRTRPGKSTPGPRRREKQSRTYSEELEQLAKLHEQGVLTDDEFAAKKKEVLGI